MQFENKNYRLRSTLCENDSMVLSGSEDGRIFAWDTVKATVIHQLWHDESMRLSEASKRKVISSVKVCPTRREWCSAAGDGKFSVSSALLVLIQYRNRNSMGRPEIKMINQSITNETGSDNPSASVSLLLRLQSFLPNVRMGYPQNALASGDPVVVVTLASTSINPSIPKSDSHSYCIILPIQAHDSPPSSLPTVRKVPPRAVHIHTQNVYHANPTAVDKTHRTRRCQTPTSKDIQLPHTQQGVIRPTRSCGQESHLVCLRTDRIRRFAPGACAELCVDGHHSSAAS